MGLDLNRKPGLLHRLGTDREGKTEKEEIADGQPPLHVFLAEVAGKIR